MDDKIVTHEDLDAIAVIERECGMLAVEGRVSELLRRLRAAAETDRPPLSEGWVAFYDDGRLAFRHLWHDGRGNLYTHDQPMAQFLVGKVGDDRYPRDLLTPLPSAVTEAEVEKAARAAASAHGVAEPWTGTIRAAFEAVGIEVIDL